LFAFPGLALLVVACYFKPQEYLPFLAGVPLLHGLVLLALLGFVVDLRLGYSRLQASPQLGATLLFIGWSILSNVPNGMSVTVRQAYQIAIPVSLFLLISHAVQTFRMLQALLAVLLAISLAIAAIGVDQWLSPWGCHRLEFAQGRTRGVPDGRECPDGDVRFCTADAADPGARYACEHPGLLGTRSIKGRVRFLGTMEDPNELALAVGAVLPLGFAFFDRRRLLRRGALVVATVALVGLCAIFTQSRGGQIVVLVALAAYFANRFGWRGLVVAGVAAAPVLLLGGRDTGEAADSTMERLECWSQGLQMFSRSPLLGVGLGQFTEHHYLTAHNSVVLVAAEAGAPGLLLLTAVVYLSIKIPVAALRAGTLADGGAPLAPVAGRWSLALAAALAGTVGGMLFLSYAYKEALWIYLGLSGALYQAIRRHAPSFRVRVGWRDFAAVVAIDAALLGAIAAYSRARGGG
jgi:hypothetical protein